MWVRIRGNLYIIGSTSGELFGNTNVGYEDIFIFSWNILYSEKLEKLIIFPNPWKPNYKKEIIISKLTKNCTLQIFDISGKLMFKTKPNDFFYSWNLQDYNGDEVSSGIYLCVVKNDKGEKKVGKIAIIK